MSKTIKSCITAILLIIIIALGVGAGLLFLNPLAIAHYKRARADAQNKAAAELLPAATITATGNKGWKHAPRPILENVRIRLRRGLIWPEVVITARSPTNAFGEIKYANFELEYLNAVQDTLGRRTYKHTGPVPRGGEINATIADITTPVDAAFVIIRRVTLKYIGDPQTAGGIIQTDITDDLGGLVQGSLGKL